MYDATQAPPQKSNRRGLAELVTVGVVAAVIGSGGTLAVVSALDEPSTNVTSSSTTTTASPASDETSGGNAGAAASTNSNPNWNATASKVSPSVVAITVQTAQSGGQGSGVIIDKEGHILTNNHVVDGGQQGQILVTLADGRGYEATIAGTDPSTDLAVLTLKDKPSDLTPIQLGDAEKLAVGDPVMAVGNPLGLAGTVTTGIVSALNRPVSTQDTSADPFGGSVQSTAVVTNAIQTSAAINPGNSGGALVDATGKLIGINSSIASLGSSSTGSQSGNIGIGFAIPVNEAQLIADQLIKDGKAQHSYLGINLTDGTEKVDGAYRSGAKVADVVAGTPAADAGVRTGDLVIKLDGDQVEGSTSLIAHIRERAVGSKVTLTVVRDGATKDLTATLAAR